MRQFFVDFRFSNHFVEKLKIYFKLVHDLLSFLNPQILKRLIQWIDDNNSNTQAGVMMALMLFVVAGTQEKGFNFDYY